MSLDNTIRISERISDYLEYHHKLPNVLIIGMGLRKEMDLNINTTTLLSELERVRCLIDIDGSRIFKIVAFSKDIEGFVLMYATLR